MRRLTMEQSMHLGQLARWPVDVTLVGLDLRGDPCVIVKDTLGLHDPYAVCKSGEGDDPLGEVTPLTEDDLLEFADYELLSQFRLGEG